MTSRKVKSSVLLASALATAAVGSVQADAAAVVPPTTASARPETANAIVTWESRKSAGYYMTVHDGGTANGSLVDTTPQDTKPQQHWAMDSTGVFYSGIMQYDALNVNSAKCLIRKTGAIGGDQLRQWSCLASDPTWGEVSTRSTDHGTKGNLLGWMLWQGAAVGGLDNGWYACEQPSPHSVHSVPAFNVRGSSPSTWLRCIWH
jgi:hypothetical protein